jgi:hypothetical protein
MGFNRNFGCILEIGFMRLVFYAAPILVPRKTKRYGLGLDFCLSIKHFKFS